MAYFRNRSVNLLNLHYGMHSLALYGGGAFFFVYLLRAGLTPAAVLVFVAATLMGRFTIRPMVVPLAARFGIRPLLIAGTLLNAVQFPLLANVQGIGPALYSLCAVTALGDTLYWTTYHAYFAALGDHEHRGHQIGAREAIVALVGIVSPIATGWALVTFGARIAFAVAACIQVLAAAPLLKTPNVAVAGRVPGAFKAALPGMMLFMTDGWVAAGYSILWQMALFLSLGESYVNFGGALAVSALAGAIGGLVLGRHIDAGHGRKIVWIATLALMVTIVLRASVLGHAALAVIASALGSLVACLYTPTFMTAIYNQAKRSACPLRFHVATEGSWDAGGASASLLAAAAIAAGAPLGFGILLALAGAAVGFVLLRRYYGNPVNAPAAASRAAPLEMS